MSDIDQSVKVVWQDGARWIERLSADPSNQCREEFNAWISQSPLHIEAYLFAKTLAELFKVSDPERRIALVDLPAESGVTALHDIDPRRAANDPRDHEHHRPRWLRPLRLAAAVLTLTCGLLWFASHYSGPPTYSTGLGEQRTLRLSDGSMVDLNTQTRIEVDFTRNLRTIKLLQGEAAFRVSHNATGPFRVVSDDAVIQALGTEFSVYRHDAITRVAVIEGRVAVASTAIEDPAPDSKGLGLPTAVQTPASAELLIAGEEADMSRRGRFVKTAHPDVAAAVSWRQRRLSFDDQPLSAVVAEFRRYTDYTITLESDTLQRRRISGVFHSDRPESLVEFLELDKSVHVERLSNGVIVKLDPGIKPST